MKRGQFLRRLKKYCRKNEIWYDWKPGKGQGKGSHGTVYVAERKSTVQDGDLENFYVYDILDYLKIPRDAV